MCQGIDVSGCICVRVYMCQGIDVSISICWGLADRKLKLCLVHREHVCINYNIIELSEYCCILMCYILICLNGNKDLDQ